MIESFFNTRDLSKNESDKDLLEVRKHEIDFQNIFTDFNMSKEIYNELKRKCHPDRFVDPELNSIASDLSLRIAENKSSYGKLCKLKEEAIKKLKINL